MDAGYHFHRVLSRFPHINKVGFGLRIDDLPSRYHLRDSVIEWEKQFWTVKHVGDEELFNAAIDTTFALYRPGIRPDSDLWWVCARTGFPYVARHLPWYEDSAAPSVEEIFYQARVKSASSHWTINDLNTIKQENTELRRELGSLRAENARLRASWDNRLEFSISKNVPRYTESTSARKTECLMLLPD